MRPDASGNGQRGLGLAPSEKSDRLFFALFPDAAAAAAIARLAENLSREHGLRGRPVPQDRLHLTLHFLGDYPADIARHVAGKAAAAAATLEAAPFDAFFDSAGSFASRGRDSPLVLRNAARQEGLEALHAGLGASLRTLGSLLRVERGFEPHVTLLYDERRVEARRIPPIGWRAREFCLIRSLLGKGGYQRLGRWPLAGPVR